MSTQGPNAPSDLGLPVGVWSSEPAGSRLEFAVKTMWGLATVKGRFERFHGQLEVLPEGARADLTIEAASFDTGHAKRDAHLGSADFFDVSNHPTLSFTATAITPRSDENLTISGDLTVAGKVVRLQLPVRVTRGEHGRLHLSTTATVPREDVGMTWNRGGMIRGDVNLTAELELGPIADPGRGAAGDTTDRQLASPRA
ncbi:MAG TPA: YceI family protein [Solirubrobacteraceae bacterium]|jgi:polyisoprenoid-binding protein YceI|nr:YceI family protein [Solirubrobacteraceae bacterium]